MFENSNKQTQEKKSTLRCAPSLLFSHEEKLDTMQRGASQGGFLLLGLYEIEPFHVQNVSHAMILTHIKIPELVNTVIAAIPLPALTTLKYFVVSVLYHNLACQFPPKLVLTEGFLR